MDMYNAPHVIYQAIFSATYRFNKSQFQGMVRFGGGCWMRGWGAFSGYATVDLRNA
jgi:hypothetical protein